MIARDKSNVQEIDPITIIYSLIRSYIGIYPLTLACINQLRALWWISALTSGEFTTIEPL
ncbi:hypothetical protein ACFQZR_24150 [Paenibacillus sp. GCM10027629]|uniref:hypothetical protein n=1 Tax=Paenibacillus sp. GCM10027629 TaxID=3273414 RepID=UPI00362BB3B6